MEIYGIFDEELGTSHQELRFRVASDLALMAIPLGANRTCAVNFWTLSPRKTEKWVWGIQTWETNIHKNNMICKPMYKQMHLVFICLNVKIRKGRFNRDHDTNCKKCDPITRPITIAEKLASGYPLFFFKRKGTSISQVETFGMTSSRTECRSTAVSGLCSADVLTIDSFITWQYQVPVKKRSVGGKYNMEVIGSYPSYELNYHVFCKQICKARMWYVQFM